MDPRDGKAVTAEVEVDDPGYSEDEHHFEDYDDSDNMDNGKAASKPMELPSLACVLDTQGNAEVVELPSSGQNRSQNAGAAEAVSRGQPGPLQANEKPLSGGNLTNWKEH